MINTFSKFYFNIEVGTENKYLNFDEGAGEITAIVRVGNYCPEDIAIAVEDALNESGTNTYSVSFNRSSRIITIESNAPTDFLASSGSNVSNSIFSTLGYAATDVLASTSYVASNAIASVYFPQYKLQDYVDQEDYREQRAATISTSASGKVQMQSFGIDRFFEFSIKFATNIPQPSSGPIVSNLSGVDNLRIFMQYLCNKYTVEFMPDKDNPDVFYKVVLHKSSSGSDGMGYKLQEQFTRGLVGYFETGILTFKIIED